MITGKTLCLNMIVRNEMANLQRCLNALADHIDCWVIGDTGSSDGTQDFIKSFFAERNKPGELHSLPFQNFEQARNAALERAYGCQLGYDYLLLADADMELVVEDKRFRERLKEPGYRLLQRGDSGLAYWNTRLIRRNAGAHYHGVTHEYIDIPGGVKELQGVWYKDHASGSNRADKFERDIKLLSAALEQDPGNHRYWFYLAQSYRDAGRTAEAAQAYAKRAQMGGWDEEAWNARLQEARCLRKLGDEGGFVRQALAAFNMRPQRAEPLYDLARFYREKGMNDASVLFSEPGLTIKRPEQDILFLEDFVYSAGLQEEYSIAANYARDPARKDRGFAACNWLALNRAVPDRSRELALWNLFFYIRPVGAMLPSFAARRVGFDPPDGYRLQNPSVAQSDQHIVVMQRTVNYELIEDGPQYRTPDNAPVHTRNFLLRLSDDLDIQSAAEILPPADMPEPACTLVLGFEDMRLFTWRGELWGSACLRELTAEGWCEQVLARIDELGPATCRLTDWRVLRPEGPRVHEKNWMPQVTGERLQFIRQCDPTRVVDDCGSTVIETTPAIAAKQFRGGSQLIAFDGGRLALIHEVQWRPSERRRYYQHRFVWFDETNTLRRVSRPFFFHKKGVELAAGLAWHPDGERLLISYGVADSEAWIATVSAGEVRGVLENAEDLPSGNSARAGDAAVNLPRRENRFDGTVVQTKINGQRISFFVSNPNDEIMKYHYQAAFYEAEELDLIKRHYTQGGTFVDIGANVGNHAIHISRFTKSSRIIVFEPNQTAISILKENLLLNQCTNVDTRFLGIALGAKKSRLRKSTPDPNNLGNTFYTEDSSGDVQSVDGDALILDEPVEFIKIDVEGMEIEVLSGLQRTVRNWRPTIFIEVRNPKAQAFLDWCACESYQIVERFQRYRGIWNYLIKPLSNLATGTDASLSGKIPGIFHFITGLDANFGGRPFSFVHYMAIRSALEVNKGFRARIYYHYEPSGRYWDAIKGDVELIHVDLPTEVFGNQIELYAHKADVLRLRILLEHGGIYLDLDTICQRPFEPLLDGRVVMGQEERRDGTRQLVGLCNATIIAPPNAEFLRKWYETFRDFKGGRSGESWNKFSVQVPMELAREHPTLLRIEPASSFFWPSWDENGIASMFAMDCEFPDAYSFHLWETKSWRFTKDLDADAVLTTDTTYNKLARRFLENGPAAAEVLLRHDSQHATAITLINLDRSTDRLQQFMRTNAHLRDVRRFSAIDGREISREDLRREGLLEGDPNYTPGAVGNFLSHVAQWKEAIMTGDSRTIAEDDAIFSYDFDTRQRALLRTAGAEWDFIIWGWNFDAYLWVDLIPGVSPAVIQTFQHQVRSGIEGFQLQCLERNLFKLLHFFGVVCYSVSPKGARRLCDFCLPLRPMLVKFPKFDVRIENRTIDNMMNGVIHEMNAFVCIPPLVVTENRHETSTVVRDR